MAEINLTLKDGTVVKAENAEEAFKTVVGMYENTKEWAKTEMGNLKTQVETAQAEAMRAAQLAEQNKPRVDNGNGFNKDQYYKLLNDDPIAAQNYLDGQRFGIEPTQVPSYFQNLDRRVSVFEQQNLAVSFVQQAEDFPQTREASTALTDRVKELQQAGYPVTVDTMNMAYRQLVDEKRITPLERQQQQQEEIPPSLGGGGSSIPDAEIQKAEQMSDADLEKFLKAKGVLK